jgi:polyhydroxyalkanoate synthase subunit PhaC
MTNPTNQTAPPHLSATHRLGPRPLALHLGTAMLTWTSSRAGSGSLKHGSPPWSPETLQTGQRLQADLAEYLQDAARTDNNQAEPDGDAWAAFLAAMDDEIQARLSTLLDGIQAYRSHPYRRVDTHAEVVWSEGTTRLLLHGDGKGKPLLIVPSLVNRFHVLDISPDRSFLDHLDRAGFAPYVVDWDRPSDIERAFTLTDYIAGRLDQALDVVLRQTGQKPALVGYCMGGLLALALAQRRQADLRSLVLLATPWDFSADAGHAPAMLATMKPSLGGIMDALGELPTDIIQSMFYAQDPMLVPRKFLRFAKMDMKSAEAEAFVALEDWINDGVPLAAPVAREALFGWYGENTPAKGTWRVAGRVVTPEAVTLPCLSLIPAQDRIVPPASAAALAAALPNSSVLRTALGHIGMVVSENARERAWDAIVDWLESKS